MAQKTGENSRPQGCYIEDRKGAAGAISLELFLERERMPNGWACNYLQIKDYALRHGPGGFSGCAAAFCCETDFSRNFSSALGCLSWRFRQRDQADRDFDPRR